MYSFKVMGCLYDQVIFFVSHQRFTLLRYFSLFTSNLGPIEKKHKNRESVRLAFTTRITPPK